jgi:carboxyl-terminal processing protease
MTMFKRLLSLSAALALCASAALAAPQTSSEKYDTLVEVDNYITQYYLYSDGVSKLPNISVFDIDANPGLYEETLDALMGALDQYSNVMSRDDFYGTYYPTTSVVGIGVIVDDSMERGVYINRVLPGGQAEQAGLLPGDMVTSVDGVDTRALNYADVTPLLRGAAWSDVTVTIRRPGELADRTFVITRMSVSVPNIEYKLLEGGVGYVIVESFGSIIDAFDFMDALDYFAAQGAGSLIIDLRGNGGGDMNTAYWMLCLLFAEDDAELFSYIDNAGVYPSYSVGLDEWEPETIAILVNGYSASASELFSGALRDNGKAVLVGETTFGKGRVQMAMELTYGDIIVLTVYKTELPVTGDYHGEGLQPDYYVENYFAAPALPNAGILGSRALFPVAGGARVEAWESCLAVMGYFRAAPDGVFDAYTMFALENYCLASGLPLLPYVSVAAIAAIQADIAALAETLVYVDAQFEAAYELCLTGS